MQLVGGVGRDVLQNKINQALDSTGASIDSVRGALEEKGIRVPDIVGPARKAASVAKRFIGEAGGFENLKNKMASNLIDAAGLPSAGPAAKAIVSAAIKEGEKFIFDPFKVGDDIQIGRAHV